MAKSSVGIKKEIEVQAKTRLVNVLCSPHCANYPCIFQATVTDEKATSLAAHPKLKYLPCRKGYSNIERLYHPDRLLYPMRRVGERGSGKWERITWDEALDQVASGLEKVKAKYGNEAIVMYHYVGRHGFPGGMAGVKANALRLFNLWGGCIPAYQRGSLCFQSVIDASRYLYGSYKVALPPDGDCKFVIIWGTNPAESAYRGGIQSFLHAKKQGTRFVTIDPAITPTATALKSEHLYIRPGTDLALGLAMINVIIKEGLFNKEMVLHRTNASFLVKESGEFIREKDVVPGGSDKPMVMDVPTGKPRAFDAPGGTPALYGSYKVADTECRPAWQLIADRVAEWTPQRAAAVTDVPAERVVTLARELATIKPAKLYFGISPGFNRTSWAEDIIFALGALNVITGNFRGIYQTGDPRLPMLNAGVEAAATQWEVPNPVTKRVPVNHLAEAILNPSTYNTNIKALFMMLGNPVNQHGNSNRTIEALKKLDLVVVCDVFKTATARYADIILPASTPMERNVLVEGSEVPRFLYHTLVDQAPKTQLFLGQPAVEPLGESKDDFEIVCLLAKKLGLGQHFPWTSSEQWIGELLEKARSNPKFPWLKDVTLDRLKKEGIVDVECPTYTPTWDLGTPSGRVELYSEPLLKKGYEPFPSYHHPKESREAAPELAAKYPLSAISHHSIWRAHSSYANMPSMLKEHPPEIWINPEDASARGIKDRDRVAVFNDRGRIELVAAVTSKMKKGVVRMPEGGWPEHGMFNTLSSDRLTTYGENPTMNTTLVEIKKI